MALVGIDLGTTNSLITVWRNGNVEILKNNMGHDMTPSVVSLEDDGSVLVGEIAKQRRVSHPLFTAAEFKRNMGTDYRYLLGEKKYSPEELSAFLLKKMLGEAEERLGEEVTEAVISVPAYFDDNQREATRRAAMFAGIEVKRLVNEPSAAIIYHQWKKENTGTEGVYLVIDFGGGTLDVSVVDCFENIIEIIAVSGNNHLGGKDFDSLIAADFCRKNGMQFGSLNKKVRENILWAAENLKKKLTAEEAATMRVMIANKSYEAVYDTNELLKVTAEVLVKMKTVINEAVKGARVTPKEIVDVVLVGGSCKMPVVQKYLSALFNREITAAEDCDNFVALGTGVLTGIISRDDNISDIVMTDVCPFSLGTGTHHGREDKTCYMSVIIPKNSILPIAKSGVYCGLERFQSKIKFDVYQGEELVAQNNLFLGNLTVKVTPDSNGDTAAEVTFCYDINGVLQVTARDLNGEHTAQKIFIRKNSQLTQEEIEQKRIDIDKEARFEKNKEENRNILAWGHRLYAQANDEYKNIIAGIVNDFAVSLENNDIVMVQRKKRYITKRLLELELIINRDCFGDDDIIAELLEDDS